MQDVLPAQATLPAPRENLFFRNDTILGICEALGEDFGFNPNWLRVALCASLYFSPAGVVGGYLAVGILVAASRFLFPAPSYAASASECTSDRAQQASEATEAPEELSLAA